MSSKTKFAFAALAVFAALAYLATAGPLDPPAGPVQTTGPTQLNAQFGDPPITLDEPGAYILTSNIVGVPGEHGVIIAADNVSLDLNGFSLIGVGGSLSGVTTAGSPQGVSVRRGVVSGWEAGGLDLADAQGVQIDDLTVHNNTGVGMDTGSRAVVARCAAFGNSSVGIRVGDDSVVTNCVSSNNGSHGLRVEIRNAAITGCTFSGNGEMGISSGFSCTIADCTLTDNGKDGVRASVGSSVQGCVAKGNARHGVHAVSDNLVRDNACTGNGDGVEGAGVFAAFGNGRIESNHLVQNTVGLDIDGAGNILADNTVRTNGDNYAIAQGNQLNLLISELPESIDWPASVELTGTLSGAAAANGLAVNSDHVSIDLAGHAMLGVVDSRRGVEADGRANVSVRNGAIVGWDSQGVRTGDRASLTRLRVVNNGLSGMTVGDASRVSGCIVADNVNMGLDAGAACVWTDSIAAMNSAGGARVESGSVVSRCSAYQNANASGVHAPFGGVISECAAYGNDLAGLSLTDGVVTNCAAVSNGDGIFATDSLVRGDVALMNAKAAILGSFNTTVENHTD